MVKSLLIEDIYIDEKFYPRISSTWKTTARYKDALESGAKFPPITVTPKKSKKGDYLLIDGAHRLEAHQQSKKKSIRADILTGLSDKQIFIEAVRRNVEHGCQLSMPDRTNAIIRLQDLKVSKMEIANILHITPKSMTRFMVDRVSYVLTGETDDKNRPVKKPIALKTILRSGFRGKIFDDPNKFKQQEELSSHNQYRLVHDLVILIENDWIDWDDKRVAPEMGRLIKLLAGLNFPGFKKK